MKSKCTVLMLFAVLFCAQAHGGAVQIGGPDDHPTEPKKDDAEATPPESPTKDDVDAELKKLDCEQLKKLPKRIDDDFISPPSADLFARMHNPSLKTKAANTRDDLKKRVGAAQQEKKCPQ